MTRKISKNQLRDFWFENYYNHKANVCGLCGNRGIIDTRLSAYSPKGAACGISEFCICPNGRALKTQYELSRLRKNI